MAKSNSHREFPRTPLAAACALALATACGGGGSSGGGSSDSGTDDSTLSAEEQAALAAVTGTATVESARDEADNSGYDESEDGPSTTSTSNGVITMSGGPTSRVLDCGDQGGEGSIHVWDSEDADNPEPNITAPDVSDPGDLADEFVNADTDTFEGNLSDGAIVEVQQRADCTLNELTFRGGFNSIRLEDGDDTVAAFSGFGSLRGDDDPVDQGPIRNDEPFEFGSASNSGEVFGTIYNCFGCPAGDLGELTANEQDSAFAGFLLVKTGLDDGSGGTRELEYGIGNVGAVQSFSLTTEHDEPDDGETTVLMNGPLAFSDSAAPDCSLDAEYVMDPNEDQGIVVENFAGDGDEIKAGSSMTVIIDEVDYDVEFKDDGVEVNGEPVDIDAEADTCGPPEQNA